MKLLSAISLALLLSVASAAEPRASAPLKGQVVETMDSGGYTYMRLRTAEGEVWAAVTNAAVKKGDQVTIVDPMMMTQFESRTLKRTFDKIVFGALAGAGTASPQDQFLSAHSGATKAPEVPVKKVPKAAGPDGRTVAEVVGQRAKLKDKTVAVRGRVVKFSAHVMGRNWLHLRDGTGSAAAGTDDLLVTTKQMAQVGDVVVARGVVRIDQDFGSGYSYQVLVEDSTLQK